ncbi:MAG TPA: hypothetical protein VJB59_09105 [Bdellovibrionota bacterium]|nr:hypothetical protein [Bdellovibrionota bacterium]
MRRIGWFVTITALITAFSASALGDDKPLLLKSNLGAGVAVGSVKSPNESITTFGGQAAVDLRSSTANRGEPPVGTILKASIGGAATSELDEQGMPENVPVGELDLTIPWTRGRDESGTAFATNHTVRGTPSLARIGVVGVGAQAINKKQSARGELYVIPYNFEADLRRDLNGMSSGVKVLGEATIKNIVSIEAAIEAGLISGMGRNAKTNSTPNCTTTTNCCGGTQVSCGNPTVVEIRSAAQQKGMGNYVSARTGMKLGVGKHAYIKAEAIYDQTGYKVVDLKSTGPQPESRVKDSAVTGLISAGISW